MAVFAVVTLAQRIDDGSQPGVQEEVTMKTILVGYDETEPSKRALARAAELAAAFEAKVIVTSVAQVLVGAAAAPRGRAIDPVDTPELHREELRHAAAFLEERGIQAEYTVALGDPAKVILELAEDQHVDLIVVGTHEASLLERLLDPSAAAPPCQRRRSAGAVAATSQVGAHDQRDFGSAFEQCFDLPVKSKAPAGARQQAECLQHPAYHVGEPRRHTHKLGASSKERPGTMRIEGLHVNRPIPSRAHDLGQPFGVVLVSLIGAPRSFVP